MTLELEEGEGRTQRRRVEESTVPFSRNSSVRQTKLALAASLLV